MDQGEYLVDLIDDQGNIIANKKRKDIVKGVDAYHAVYCVVVTPEGKICISTIANRQDMPNLHAGKHGCTAATIKRTDETPDQAAKRAVQDELSIEATPELLHQELLEIDETHRLVGWYRVESEKPNDYSKADIDEISELSEDEFRKLLQDSPQKITPPLKKFWEIYKKQCKNS